MYLSNLKCEAAACRRYGDLSSRIVFDIVHILY